MRHEGQSKKAHMSGWMHFVLIPLGALVLVAIGAVFAIPMFWNRMSVEVSLKPSACSRQTFTQNQGFQHNALPCHFTAYLFPSAGGWVAVGKEGDMEHQCVLIPYVNLDDKATRTKHFNAGMMQLPGLKKACRGSYAVYHPKMRWLGGWHQFWSWDHLAGEISKEMQ